jgi:SH3-like domain-containing protein
MLIPVLTVLMAVQPVQALAEQVRPQPRPIEATPAAVTIAPTEVTVAVEAPALRQIEPTSVTGPILGPETNLPLPRFVSLKTDEGNVRRGPSLSHRIDWVYLRRGMPLQVTAEYGHWRRVSDREGLGGWVHYALLSGTRTVLIEENLLPIYTRPDLAAPQDAVFEAGVIARLGDCSTDWCEVTSGGYHGWAEKTALWGVMPDEIRE